MKKSAFTLIELLVVIAIIAILVSIALPVFAAAQEKAKVVKDANNLHQLGLSCATYLNDNSDSIFIKPSGAGTPQTWPQQLNPRYVQIWKVFQSPFDSRTPSERGSAAPVSPVSYGTNDNLYGTASGKTMSDIVSPSLCIFMAPLMDDPVQLKFSGNAAMDVAVKITSNGTAANGGTHSRGKRINVLFADWHVSDMTMVDFHTALPNSSSTAVIKDVRWNKP